MTSDGNTHTISPTSPSQKDYPRGHSALDLFYSLTPYSYRRLLVSSIVLVGHVYGTPIFRSRPDNCGRELPGFSREEEKRESSGVVG